MTGSEIRTLRRSLKLTQREFAKKLGVAQNTVARWETDQVKPSPLAVIRIGELQKKAKKWLPEQDSNLQPSG